MDKKIIKLSLTEIQAVVGGVREINVTAMRQPAKQQVSQPSRYETLLVRR